MNTQHERTVYELIEANGLTLHGDIEHFAELVREDERERIFGELLRMHEIASSQHNYYLHAVVTIRARS